MAKILFIKPEDVKRKSIFDGDLDNNKFMQYIEIAQEIHIQNYLGTKLYDRLREGIENTDLTADETTLIKDYVQDALIHFAAAEFLPFSHYQVKNGGVFKHVSENASNVDKEEVDYLAQKERDFAEYYTKRMVDYLCENKDLYPEYSTNTGDDIDPSNEINYTGGWYLGDAIK